MKEKIGIVTEEEKLEILKLYERLNGLEELAKIIDASNNDLYERLILDVGHTKQLYQDWWNKMSQKYNWQSTEDGKWSIDFNTNEITLN